MRLILLFISVIGVQSAYEIKDIQCDKDNHKGCLVWDNNTQNCYTVDCWKWDTIKQSCIGQKDFVGPMVLQSIPFTGVFGSGFGNMGRWDIFGIYQAVVWGPIVLLCCVLCCVAAKSDDDDATSSEDTIKLCSTCFTCVYTIAVLALWVWGIVSIAEKRFKAPWVNEHGATVMCELYSP